MVIYLDLSQSSLMGILLLVLMGLDLNGVGVGETNAPIGMLGYTNPRLMLVISPITYVLSYPENNGRQD